MQPLNAALGLLVAGFSDQHRVRTRIGRERRCIKPDVPFVVRLDGTNDKEGRALLAEADLPNVHTEATMLGAAKKVVELAAA